MGMRIIGKISRKSILTTWLMSYLLVLFLPVLLGSAILFQSGVMARKQLEYYNNSVSALLITENDRIIVEQMKAAVTASTDDEIQQVMRMKKPLSAEDHKALYQLREKMRNYSLQFYGGNSNQKFFIFFKDIDCVVNSSYVCGAEQFYSRNYSKTDGGFEEWMSLLSQSEPVYFRKISESGAERLCYAMPIDAFGKSVFVVERDLPDLSKTISGRINESLMSEWATFTGNGDMIFCTDEFNKLSDEKLAELVKHENGMVNIGGKRYYLCTQISDETGLKYLTAVSDIAWNKTLLSMRVFGACMLLISVIGGLIFIFFAMRYNYMPIKEILSNLHGQMSINDDTAQNELEIIREAVSDVMNEYIRVSKQADVQAGELKKQAIYNMLLGQAKAADLNNSNFAGKSFAVALFEFDDFTRLFEGEENISEAEKLRTVIFMLENIVRDVFNDGIKGYVVRVDSRAALLLAMDDTETPQKRKTQLFESLLDIKRFMKENLYVSLSVSLSGIVSCAERIEAAYREASEVQQYKFYLGTDVIITGDDISAAKDGCYAYSMENEQKLVNYIKTADEEKALALIDGIFSENDLSLDMLKCLAYSMVGTIFRIADNDGDEEFKKLAENLLDFETIIDLKEKLFAAVHELCGHYQPKKGDLLCARVKKVVEEQYSNPELSVAYIADILGVQYVYLSASFKSFTGEGVLEYISRVRIDKSKEFLRDPLMSVEDVSAKVGYTTSKTFIRVFKKLEGVTPASYRKHAVIEAQK